jgi:FkbM family methyltransferase
MKVLRTVADVAEKMTGLKISKPERVGLLFEQIHLNKLVKAFEVDCFFDVGANAGQYARMLREQVGFRGEIISFEPIPALASHLRQAASRDSKWHVEQLALDRTEGRATFNIMNSDQFSSLHRPDCSNVSRFVEMNKVSSTVEVEISTIAKQFEIYQARLGFNRPFLKMDTQGHDLEVAKGASNTLREFVGLQSELAIQRIYTDAPSYQESLAYYESQGFVLSALVPNNEGHFPDLIEIDCIMYNRPATLRWKKAV